MKFSICVPNYNYARYIGKAIQSLLEQSHRDLEVVVSDNCSTDDSVAVVQELAKRDPRVRVRKNACNVGFAGNLDRSVQMATGDRILVFASDDLMRPGAIELFQRLYDRLGSGADGAILNSTEDMIDPEDNITGRLGPDPELFHESDRAAELERELGAPVYHVRADELLRRCLRTMRNPFNLTTTVYPRALYERVEGFGGGRLINPDKWFHWRLLGVAQDVYFVDKSLGACRWHPNNQTFQQAASGALKYLVDEYVSTFEFDKAVLERLGLTRTDLERSFIEYDIARHGLATLAGGNKEKARRIFTFGHAAYPKHARANQKMWALGLLLAAGPLGRAAASVAYKAMQGKSPE